MNSEPTVTMHDQPAVFTLQLKRPDSYLHYVSEAPPPPPCGTNGANAGFSLPGVDFGDGSRFSALSILAPAFFRSRGIVSTRSVCVNSTVIFFCTRHCLKTFLLAFERATTLRQRLPDLPERGLRTAAPSQPSRGYLGAVLQRLLQQEFVHGGHGAAARERGTGGGDARRSRT